ncbi:hypothetical protein QBC35DRAFT_503696 [Podospora australis]|uniref:Indoleamine 2,3-dioxygenase n=1 Tax=Podospora australis TaxID=1536484 RepID=A0AAN7AGU7_9PEZI|nr:hypothetical protein QBC35DRAFT_503696 [Podospora australis]
MLLITEFVLLSIIGSVFTVLLSSVRPWIHKNLSFTSSLRPKMFHSFSPAGKPSSSTNLITNGTDSRTVKSNKQKLQEIFRLSDCHEAASVLSSLVKKDGAGAWPPLANHTASTWPAALQPYKEIYLEMAPLLPAANVSLDDNVNLQRISFFRTRFAELLSEKVDLQQVNRLLEAADAGRWDIFPRDVYNGFYCCVAWCRHAYRWATIPVVRVAQLEKTVTLPQELVSPWDSMQSHFGLDSESGNNMSNLVLNFDPSGEYALRINTGLSHLITSSEEEFGRIFHEVEVLAVPVYHAIVMSIVSFARGNQQACLGHVKEIMAQLRPLLSSYYDRVHDSKIARSVWLRNVQGFYGWGVGSDRREPITTDSAGQKEWEKFDGLSGNQVLLFQALDAFLGLEAYLPKLVQERNVPELQRDFCDVVGKYGFRHLLSDDGIEGEIKNEFGEIVKRLRVFRSAHRTRAKVYLSQPAPERLPMTAGKSLLKDSIDDSLEMLDQFMMGRLQQTV